ncbi:hypothetical protein [Leptospira dzoumogneensis]|uniref:Uncharacterized protein n=1 Tax=Leptospira dzoumogneensis TaxID=2484904 RepID=A0A4Z1AQT2_9LEPT|nr:hypothetical protein [Leptospira dzoumogneensis]TGN01981.1 hypothetical protein EHR06_06125 [Leptospira dzoumogneensis]
MLKNKILALQAIIFFNFSACDHKPEENLTPLIECGGLAICAADWQKSGLPEFVGTWKNENSADSCNQTKITYIFDDTVITEYDYKQTSSCNVISSNKHYFEWNIDSASGDYCETDIAALPKVTNCYPYSINSTDLTIYIFASLRLCVRHSRTNFTEAQRDIDLLPRERSSRGQKIVAAIF